MAARCLWGIAWAFIKLGAYFAITDFSTEKNRSYLFGLHKGYSRVGMLIGMVAGGGLVDLWGLLLVTIVFSSLSLAFIPVVYIGLTSSKIFFVKDEKFSTTKHVLKETDVIWIVVYAILIAIVYDGILKSTLSYLVNEQIEGDMHFFVWLVGAATIGGNIISNTKQNIPMTSTTNTEKGTG